jgi:sugar phosphate isomerase/epimerase
MTDLLDDIGCCIGTLGPDPFTIAQDLPPVFDAIAASGTRSVSLHTFLGAMHGIDGLTSMLDAAGLRVGALEAALAWSKGPSDEVRAEAELICSVAEATGATALLTVTLDPEWDEGAAIEGYGQLCELVAPAGVQPCLEWLPWTAMPTIATAHRVMTASGADNGGLTFDTWHWMRQPGGPDLGTLARCSGAQIGYLQLCDVAPTPGADVFVEAMSARVLPGDGVVDFAGVLATLDAMGATPYVASEIFNAEILADGPPAAARAFHDACERLRTN